MKLKEICFYLILISFSGWAYAADNPPGPVGKPDSEPPQTGATSANITEELEGEEPEDEEEIKLCNSATVYELSEGIFKGSGALAEGAIELGDFYTQLKTNEAQAEEESGSTEGENPNDTIAGAYLKSSGAKGAVSVTGLTMWGVCSEAISSCKQSCNRAMDELKAARNNLRQMKVADPSEQDSFEIPNPREF